MASPNENQASSTPQGSQQHPAAFRRLQSVEEFCELFAAVVGETPRLVAEHLSSLPAGRVEWILSNFGLQGHPVNVQSFPSDTSSSDSDDIPATDSTEHQPSPGERWSAAERGLLTDMVYLSYGIIVDPTGHNDSTGQPRAVFWDALEQAYNDTGGMPEMRLRSIRQLLGLPEIPIGNPSNGALGPQIRPAEPGADFNESVSSLEDDIEESDEDETEDESTEDSPPASNGVQVNRTYVNGTHPPVSQLDGSDDPPPSHPVSGRRPGTPPKRPRSLGANHLLYPPGLLYQPGLSAMPPSSGTSTPITPTGTGNYRMIEAATNSTTAMEVEALHLIRIAEAGITPVIRLPFEGEREYRRRLRDNLPLFNEDDIPMTELRLRDDETLDSIAEAQIAAAEGTKSATGTTKSAPPAKKRKVMSTKDAGGKK